MKRRGYIEDWLCGGVILAVIVGVIIAICFHETNDLADHFTHGKVVSVAYSSQGDSTQWKNVSVEFDDGRVVLMSYSGDELTIVKGWDASFRCTKRGHIIDVKCMPIYDPEKQHAEKPTN